MRQNKQHSATAAILMLALSLAHQREAAAATIEVTTPLDVIATDGLCSLREAIDSANRNMASSGAAGECAAGAGVDLIRLPAGIFNITRVGVNDDTNATGDFDILESVTIVGQGPGVSGINAGGIDRAFDLRAQTGAVVTMEQLGIIGGQAPAFASGAPRGAPRGATSGGGIRVAARTQLLLRHMNFAFNRAGNSGGASNDNPGDGGAIAVEVPPVNITIEDSSFIGNRASSASANAPSSPNAAGRGGAIFQAFRTLTIRRTLFENNEAGAGNAAGRRGGEGGAIYALAFTNLQISASSFIGNRAGIFGGRGGAIAIAVDGQMLLEHVTLSGNRSDDAGGAIYAVDSQARLRFVTITANTAPSGGAALLTDNRLTMENSVIAGNIGPPGSVDCYIDSTAMAQINGFNVFGRDGGCIRQGFTDLQVDSPRLSALDRESGMLPIHHPLDDSPALDAAWCTATDTADQRGAVRPQDLPNVTNRGNGCDSGAIERQGDGVFRDSFE